MTPNPIIPVHLLNLQKIIRLHTIHPDQRIHQLLHKIIGHLHILDLANLLLHNVNLPPANLLQTNFQGYRGQPLLLKSNLGQSLQRRDYGHVPHTGFGSVHDIALSEKRFGSIEK